MELRRRGGVARKSRPPWRALVPRGVGGWLLALAAAFGLVLLVLVLRLGGSTEAGTDLAWAGAAGAAECARPPPLVCAHNGDVARAGAGAVPNSLRALAAAAAAGHRCVEVDAAASADGVLVALHRREAARLSGRDGASAADFTEAQAKALGAPGTVPTVAETLQALANSGLEQITVDLKEDGSVGAEDLARLAVQEVERARCAECVVWAKSDELVRAVQRLLKEREVPGARVGFVVFNDTQDARDAGMGDPARMPGTPVAAVHWALAGTGVVDTLRTLGVEAHAWTANQPHMMRAALDAGVDAIVTDVPSTLAAAITARRRKCGASVPRPLRAASRAR